MALFLPTILLLLGSLQTRSNSVAVAAAGPSSPPPSLLDTVLSFQSRPDIRAPRLYTHHVDPAQLSAGYIFLSPWRENGVESGPYIYTATGELVWAGTGAAAAGNVHGVRPCRYRDQPHLCFFEGIQYKDHAAGRGVVLDSSYRAVRQVRSGAGRAAADMHEFELVGDGSTALLTYYEAAPWDLSNHKLYHSLGWIVRSGFQEVHVDTGEVIFDWDPLDHVGTGEGQAAAEKAGFSKLNPWDYFHLNSVHKDARGDYLLSSRHTNSLLKVSGADGRILWRLGGPKSNFTLAGFELGYQHHARILEETDDHIAISVFNNGWDGRSELAFPHSYGAVLDINLRSKAARLTRRYSPASPLQSRNQGSIEPVEGSENMLLSWGSNAFISEHLPDGTLIQNLSIASNTTSLYRAYKGQWTGQPADLPAVWAYAKNESSKTVIYASWNGATEVHLWRFYSTDATAAGQASRTVIGTALCTGFETQFIGQEYHRHVLVEALSENGTSLSNSTDRRTFSPSPEVSSYCNELKCPIKVFDAMVDDDLILPSSPSINDKSATDCQCPLREGSSLASVPAVPISQAEEPVQAKLDHSAPMCDPEAMSSSLGLTRLSLLYISVPLLFFNGLQAVHYLRSRALPFRYGYGKVAR